MQIKRSWLMLYQQRVTCRALYSLIVRYNHHKYGPRVTPVQRASIACIKDEHTAHAYIQQQLIQTSCWYIGLYIYEKNTSWGIISSRYEYPTRSNNKHESSSINILRVPYPNVHAPQGYIYTIVPSLLYVHINSLTSIPHSFNAGDAFVKCHILYSHTVVADAYQTYELVGEHAGLYSLHRIYVYHHSVSPNHRCAEGSTAAHDPKDI
jgi:hypothetical protein